MANKFQEEIKSKDELVVEPDYNPLDESVNEKKYSQPNVNTTDVDFSKPIEEPTFTPPPFQKKKPQQTSGEEKPKREPINPEMKNLSKKETDMAASQAASMIMHGYEWLHQMGNKWLQVSDRKLAKLQAEGEINLSAMIDYDYGKRVPAYEFLQEYNSQVENLLVVSQEFKDEVTPILERVLSKRGIGMSDENMLMFLFGKDIAVKSMIIFQQKQIVKQMIESIKMATMQQSAPPPPPMQPMPEPTPEPTPTPRPTKKEKTYDDSELRDEQEFEDIIEDEYIKKGKEKAKTGEVIILEEKKGK